MSNPPNFPKKKKIVVVDDNEGILDALEVMLETAGYEVSISPDGAALKNLNKKSLPDLILLDVLLSGVDGREICRDLKSAALTKDIPIIMISAHPDASSSTKYVGADEFLAKPFDISDLMKMVEKHI